MKRKPSGIWVSICTGCIVVALLLCSVQPSGVLGRRLLASYQYTLPGYAILQPDKFLHRTAKNEMMHLSIGLRSSRFDKLDALIAAQNNPRSLQYHHYIAPYEFASLFGASPQMVASVVAFLQGQGLTISTISSSRLFVDATGPVKNVEHAFHVAIADYVLEGQIVYAPMNDPVIPASLVSIVMGIVGLDNVQRYLPHYVRGRKPHSSDSEEGYTPDELRTAYDIAPLIHNGDNGSGQVIALLELDGYLSSDIDKYLEHYKLGAPRYSNILVDGATNEPGPEAVEVNLDMEVAAAIAPGAKQIVYITQNTAVGVIDGYNQIVSDNLAKVVSSSWGLCEEQVGRATISVLANLFKQAAVQGQSVFAASGDSGAYACGSNTLGVEAPADIPYVVGVGGTSLDTAWGGKYLAETAWSCSICIMYGPNGAGSGGGISEVIARPAYQHGPGQFYANRTVPDVAANADPTTGYAIYCTVGQAGCSGSGWYSVGGTSAATPLWAGIMLDASQYLVELGKSGPGNVSETLYKLFNVPQPFPAYHDVTTGNNLYYQAHPGYDLTTGMGSPDAWNMVRDLSAMD